MVETTPSKVHQSAPPPDIAQQVFEVGDDFPFLPDRMTLCCKPFFKNSFPSVSPPTNRSSIRHAYLLPQWQRQGIGSKLLNHLKGLVTTSHLLMRTWADAHWAITFYKKYGFSILPNKDVLLKTYWDTPQRQIETSIVMGIRIK